MLDLRRLFMRSAAQPASREFENAVVLLDEQFREALAPKDFKRLKSIIDGNPEDLSTLCGRMSFIHLPPKDRWEPGDGRTVYLHLQKPIDWNGRIIKVLRLKGVRPRAAEDGRVFPYLGRGHVPKYADVTGKGNLSPSNPQVGPFGTMLALGVRSADHELRCMEESHARGFKADAPLGLIAYRNLTYLSEPVGGLIAGMGDVDWRLALAHCGASSEGLGPVQTGIGGDVLGGLLKRVDQEEIFRAVGKSLRACHDSGLFHGFFHIENIGLQRQGNEWKVVFRDWNTGMRREALCGIEQDVARQEAAYRFRDLGRFVHDFQRITDEDYKKAGFELVHVLVESYFGSSYVHELGDVASSYSLADGFQSVMSQDWEWNPSLTRKVAPLFHALLSASGADVSRETEYSTVGRDATALVGRTFTTRGGLFAF